jgi:hypothetical protein
VFPVSHFLFSGDRETIIDLELIDAVANVTGEDSHEMRRRVLMLTAPKECGPEPDVEGYWWADMGPSGWPVLGVFGCRTQAVGEESEG